MTRKDQKEEERIYLEKFLECIGYKPECIENDRENPDFIITIESKRIGVEVTKFHSKTDSDEKFSRREVEGAWDKLQESLENERNKYEELQSIYGALSFKRLEVPPRRKHKEFINEIIKYTLSKLPIAKNIEQDFSDFLPKYPLMNEYLKSVYLENPDCYITWEWNHNTAWVGLLEEELIDILEDKKEKLKKYETTNIHEMWLVIVSGHLLSQAIGKPHPEILNDYSICNELLKQSGFDKVYLYQYLDGRVFEWFGDWKIRKEKTRKFGHNEEDLRKLKKKKREVRIAREIMMNENQRKNIEEAIDLLCENLVWTWAYHQALINMHTHALKSDRFINDYPQLISCIYHGLFDALFMRLYHFIDTTKRASGFPYLFKIICRYCKEDRDIIQQVSTHNKRITNEEIFEKISNWRHEVIAHLTKTQRDQVFFKDNKLRLAELDLLISEFEEILEVYSKKFLNRVNDTRTPSNKLAREISEIATKYTDE